MDKISEAFGYKDSLTKSIKFIKFNDKDENFLEDEEFFKNQLKLLSFMDEDDEIMEKK